MKHILYNCSFYCQSIKENLIFFKNCLKHLLILFFFLILFVANCSSSLISARLKAFKMSLDQVPVVTKLLRASRSCNEMLLKDCFKEILESGISVKDLNATDKSGRVSTSMLIYKYYNIVVCAFKKPRENFNLLAVSLRKDRK